MGPMRSIASLFALVLTMALFHRVTAASPLEARATLAFGFLLLAAYVGGELAAASTPVVTQEMMNELDARGPDANTLLRITVVKDVAVAILFTLVLANGGLLTSAGALNAAVAGTSILRLVGSAAAGTLLGF